MADELTPTIQPEGGETPPTPATPTSQTPAEEPFDRDRAMRTIETLREQEKQAKRLQRELEQAQARLKAIDEEKLSETERLSKQKAELEAALHSERARNRDLVIRTEIEREAHKQGAVDAEAVYALINRGAIEITDDGTVKGAGKAVKDLLEDKPYLKAGAPYSGSAAIPETPRGGSRPAMEAAAEQDYQRMKASGKYRL